MLRRLGVVPVVLTLGILAVTVLPPGTANAEVGSNAFRRWIKVNARAITADQALAIANRAEVVVADQFALVPHVAAMHAAHPGIRILVYVNGTYSRPDEVYPEGLYLHDAQGRRITALSDGGVLMNPGRAAWRNDVANDCSSRRAQTGYDGCYIDVLGVAPLNDSYGSSLPIRPRTGLVWTAAEWLNATSGLGSRVTELNPGAFILANGLQNGKRYADSTGASAVILNGVNGGNAEDFIRVASAPADEARPEWMWKADVDMLVDAGSRGKSVFAMTKVWVSATQEQIDRIHEYALASFLLGTNGTSYFTFYSDLDRMNVDEVTRRNRVDSAADIGVPTGGYSVVGSVYTRAFTGGLVLVNPTAVATSVTLPQLLLDLDGVALTSVTLAPNTASILRNII